MQKISGHGANGLPGEDCGAMRCAIAPYGSVRCKTLRYCTLQPFETVAAHAQLLAHVGGRHDVAEGVDPAGAKALQ